MGDLGASDNSPTYTSAAGGQNGASLGQGQGYVFSGDVPASPFASADDPSPAANGGFGAAFSPIGDVAGDFLGELLIGATGGGINDVHVYSACAERHDYPDDHRARRRRRIRQCGRTGR